MVDRSGVRSSVQVADLREYGGLSSMKRWAWEKMKVWTMVVAAPAVPCCPSSKISSRAQMLLPPPHPMTTAFGSIGAESNEWARVCVRLGWCPRAASRV